eukprot:15202-Heterococcus_DN1.PRE.5
MPACVGWDAEILKATSELWGCSYLQGKSMQYRSSSDLIIGNQEGSARCSVHEQAYVMSFGRTCKLRSPSLALLSIEIEYNLIAVGVYPGGFIVSPKRSLYPFAIMQLRMRGPVV